MVVFRHYGAYNVEEDYSFEEAEPGLPVEQYWTRTNYPRILNWRRVRFRVVRAIDLMPSWLNTFLKVYLQARISTVNGRDIALHNGQAYSYSRDLLIWR